MKRYLNNLPPRKYQIHYIIHKENIKSTTDLKYVPDDLFLCDIFSFTEVSLKRKKHWGHLWSLLFSFYHLALNFKIFLLEKVRLPHQRCLLQGQLYLRPLLPALSGRFQHFKVEGKHGVWHLAVWRLIGCFFNCSKFGGWWWFIFQHLILVHLSHCIHLVSWFMGRWKTIET